jgi:hypothetical protein
LEELIGKIFLFYEAQETGTIRPANRVSWKGNSYLDDKHKGRSLAGGWFDGGGMRCFRVLKVWTCTKMSFLMSRISFSFPNGTISEMRNEIISDFREMRNGVNSHEIMRNELR